MTQALLPDEDDVRDFVQDYSDIKRLTPSRANDLLDKIMADTQPTEPDPDECCGSSCCPCVMDTWREEVAIWKAFRTPPGKVDAEAMAKKYPN